MASTNGKYFEDQESDRYGVLGLECPLPEKKPDDSAAEGGESGADSPETALRGGGDGDLSGDFTSEETASPPAVLADEHVPGEVRDLLQEHGEWDALDAIYEQLHQVEATLHRVRRALQALTDVKTAALPGNSAALLKGNRRRSNRDDFPPFLKSEAEETPDPGPVPVSRAAKKPQEADEDFRPVVHREPGERRPPRPRVATTIQPLRPPEKPQDRAVRWSPDHAHTADRRSAECDVDSATGRPAVERIGEVGRPAPSAGRPAPSASTNGEPREKRSGRSSRVLTDEVRSTVVHYLEAGLSIRQAAAFVGCHHTTIIKATQRDREFAARIERAGEIGRAMPLVRIIRASRRCWRAAAWLLRHQGAERR